MENSFDQAGATLRQAVRENGSGLEEVLSSLIPLERRFLELRAGLPDQRPCTVDEVAARLGLTPAVTIRLEQRCVAKLQKPGRHALLHRAPGACLKVLHEELAPAPDP